MTPRRALPRRVLNLPRLITQLRHYHIENKGLKLLALLVAFLLFIVSRQPTREVLLVGVPIEFRGLRAGLEVSGDVAQTVSVRLRGAQDVVRNLLPNQVAVVSDLSNKEPGERVVQLRPSDVSRPDHIEVLRIEPASIKLRLEPTISKWVSVTPQFLGEVANGDELYSANAEPATAEIEGPQSHIAKINHAPTESIRLDGRQASFKTTVDIDIPDHLIRVIRPSPVNVSIEIGEHRSERRLANLPVEWIDKPATASLLTSRVEVTLYGPRSALEALRPNDIRVEISTANLPATATTAEPRVRLLTSPNAHIEVKSIAPSEVKLKR